jgi:hypothetical protein
MDDKKDNLEGFDPTPFIASEKSAKESEGKEEVRFEEDFIMLPYYGPAPLSFAPGVITAWGLGFITMLVGFVSAWFGNDAKCVSDKCKLLSLGFLAGGIFIIFIGGLFILAGFAMMTAPRRRISKEARDKQTMIALSGELQAEIAKREMMKYMSGTEEEKISPKQIKKEQWPESLPKREKE